MWPFTRRQVPAGADFDQWGKPRIGARWRYAGRTYALTDVEVGIGQMVLTYTDVTYVKAVNPVQAAYESCVMVT